jgi:allene oxide cyclase
MTNVIRALPAALLMFALTGVSPAAAHSMTFVERATSDAVLDLGAKDDSAGDVLTFANEMFDAGNTKKMGSNQGWCMRIVAGKSWECTMTVMLDRGQLTVQGPFLDGQDSVWAITGGTGKYLRTHGEMKLHARDAKGSEFDMEFNLR